jgi:hypothetical protein
VLIHEFPGNEIVRIEDPSLLNCIFSVTPPSHGRRPDGFVAAETRKQQGEEAKQPRGPICFMGVFVSDENGLKSRAEIAFAVSHFMHVDAKVQGLF